MPSIVTIAGILPASPNFTVLLSSTKTISGLPSAWIHLNAAFLDFWPSYSSREHQDKQGCIFLSWHLRIIHSTTGQQHTDKYDRSIAWTLRRLSATLYLSRSPPSQSVAGAYTSMLHQTHGYLPFSNITGSHVNTIKNFTAQVSNK